MSQIQQPTREAFAAYWKGYGTSSFRDLLPHGVYVGGLASYIFVVRLIDPETCFWIAWLAIAGAYIVLLPYFWIRRIQTRHAQFIRCPECGNWFGQDFSEAYRGPNPKFTIVIQTGRCSKCGKQILAEA